MVKRGLIGVAIVVLCSAVMQAQAGPYTVTFTASANHDVVEHTQPVVTGYQVIVTPVGGSDLPAQDLGKPTPDGSGVIAVSVDTYLKTLPVGDYAARIRAVGPGGEAVSADSAPFALTISAPAAPGTPVVSR